MTSIAQQIIGHDREFLQFLRSRYPFFHASNVFFRDLHYGVMAYLEQQDRSQGYVQAETVTREIISHFEKAGILRPINERTWMLNLEEFRAVSKKPAAPAPAAKPAAAAGVGSAPKAADAATASASTPPATA